MKTHKMQGIKSSRGWNIADNMFSSLLHHETVINKEQRSPFSWDKKTHYGKFCYSINKKAEPFKSAVSWFWLNPDRWTCVQLLFCKYLEHTSRRFKAHLNMISVSYVKNSGLPCLWNVPYKKNYLSLTFVQGKKKEDFNFKDRNKNVCLHQIKLRLSSGLLKINIG